MPRKPIELAPAVAGSFLKHVRAFCAEKTASRKTKWQRDEYGCSTQHLKPREKKLSLLDVREIFLQMRDHA